MRNILKTLLLTCAIAAMPAVNCEGAIQNMAVRTLDGLGKPASSFSEGGQIGLEISFYNSEAVDRVYFEFYVYDPSGNEVFRHTGNSAPGNTGNKSSSVRNIPLAFYRAPGYYSFRGVAKTESLIIPEEKSLSFRFRILPGSINLTYPPNGMKNISDNPLVFRWYSSGTDKYKVYLDDNPGFLNPIWSSESDQASIEYPEFPSDPRQKLSSGVEYWWKVDGLDVTGSKILETRSPFSFTLKEATANDIAVDKIGMLVDSEKEEIFIFTDIRNTGGTTGYNIPVSAYFNGAQAGSAKNIDVIQPGETKRITFDCSDRSIEVLGSNESVKVVISAMVDFTDDNAKNNLLTAELKIELEKARLEGRITTGDSPAKGIEGASVFYSGPVSGEAKTNPGGHFRIENLPLGEYSIRASKDGYDPPQPLVIRVDRRKAYTGNNFILSKTGEEAVLLIGEPVAKPDEVYSGDSIIIQVRVKDSKGAEKIELLFQLPGDEAARIIEMKRISGDQKEGIYEAVIKQ